MAVGAGVAAVWAVGDAVGSGGGVVGPTALIEYVLQSDVRTTVPLRSVR